MNPERVLVRRPEVLEAEVDGDRILMSGSDYKYFGLVGTGALIWDRIDGTMPVGEMIRSLAAEFSTAADVIERDVTAFVSALDAAGLLEP